MNMASNFKTHSNSQEQRVYEMSNQLSVRFGSELPTEYVISTGGSTLSEMKTYRELFKLISETAKANSLSKEQTDKLQTDLLNELVEEANQKIKASDDELLAFMTKLASAFEKAIKAKILENIAKREDQAKAFLEYAEENILKAVDKLKST